MINSILEKRKVNDGIHSIVLEVSKEEYKKVYDDYNNEIASEIVRQHLENRGDDGRPTDIQIQHTNSEIIRIFANLHYLGNDHTSYQNNY
ncbi:MAG: hypothetical protein GX347_05475 [Epulopiscium sp.]|nr:hypothetical protein [Candidatus Epulonipiscium sp.]